MTRIKALPYLFFFFLSFSTALARLDETEPQCLARYGPEVTTLDLAPNVKMASIEKDGVRVTATFLRSIVTNIYFRKDDSSPLSDNEITALLAANSRGQAWKDMSHEPLMNDSICWMQNDGSMALMNKNRLVFSSPADKETQEIIDRHPQKTLSGF